MLTERRPEEPATTQLPARRAPDRALVSLGSAPPGAKGPELAVPFFRAPTQALAFMKVLGGGARRGGKPLWKLDVLLLRGEEDFVYILTAFWSLNVHRTVVVLHV